MNEILEMGDEFLCLSFLLVKAWVDGDLPLRTLGTLLSTLPTEENP